MKTYTHAQLRELVGQEIGVSDWLAIDQDRIDRFAGATGDDQWIHVDPERAAAGPFGATIAHGYLTLSLVAGFAMKTFRFAERMSINYGLNKVRFPTPVKVGSRVRARFALKSIEPFEGGPGGARGVQVVTTVTIELEGSERPACVAESVRLGFE